MNEQVVLHLQTRESVYGPSRTTVKTAKPLIAPFTHSKAATCVATMKHILATGSEDGYVQLYNLQTRKEIGAIAVRPSPIATPSAINCIAVSEDARVVITGTHDGLARAWSCENGACVRTYKIKDNPHTQIHAGAAVTSLRINKNVLICGYGDGSLCWYDLREGKCLRTMFTGEPAKMYNLKNKTLFQLPGGHYQPISGAFVTSSGEAFGQCAYSGGWDGLLCVWELDTPLLDKDTVPLRVLRGHTDRITCVSCDTDMKTLITASYDGTAKTWRASGARTEQLRVLEHFEPISACSAGDRLIVTGSLQGSVLLWRQMDGHRLRCDPLLKHIGAVRAAVCPQFGPVAFTAGNDGTIRVWDAALVQDSHDATDLVECAGVLRHGASISSLALNEQFGVLISVADDGSVKIWDVKEFCSAEATGEELLFTRSKSIPIVQRHLPTLGLGVPFHLLEPKKSSRRKHVKIAAEDDTPRLSGTARLDFMLRSMRSPQPPVSLAFGDMPSDFIDAMPTVQSVTAKDAKREQKRIAAEAVIERSRSASPRAALNARPASRSSLAPQSVLSGSTVQTMRSTNPTRGSITPTPARRTSIAGYLAPVSLPLQPPSPRSSDSEGSVASGARGIGPETDRRDPRSLSTRPRTNAEVRTPRSIPQTARLKPRPSCNYPGCPCEGRYVNF
eukprot:TRINITY_DN3327_c0_g1_i3.p1 TRINITY_DN3327_c0_g1~~TRINITY_DN3327_c0_g1_i3.p1  ORF type:complete len:674 (+),score=90.96 TRINITY_DN3327_c0_g1_i3:53-2074(+)